MLILENDIVTIFEIPIEKTIVKKYDKFLIRKIDIDINNKSAHLSVLINDINAGAEQVYINISGEDYDKWGDDDTYIFNYCKQWLINNF